MLKFILLLAPVLILISCGHDTDPNGYTKVSFNYKNGSGSHAKAIATTVTNGLVIYAVNTNEPNIRGSIFLSNESGSGSMVIPKGNFQFFGVAAPSYSTSAYLDYTDTYCGASSIYSLAGGDLSVNLTLSTAGCFSNPLFNSVNLQNASQNGIGTVYFTTCNSAGYVANASNFSGNCSGAQGNVASIRLRFPDYGANFSGNTNPSASGLAGTCIDFPGDTLIYSSVGVLGEQNAAIQPFMAVVTAYATSGCQTPLGEYVFPNGLTASPYLPGGYATAYTSTNAIRFFLKNLDDT